MPPQSSIHDFDVRRSKKSAPVAVGGLDRGANELGVADDLDLVLARDFTLRHRPLNALGVPLELVVQDDELDHFLGSAHQVKMALAELVYVPGRALAEYESEELEDDTDSEIEMGSDAENSVESREEWARRQVTA